MEAIQKYGTMIRSPSGYPTPSPYIAIANRQAEIMMRIAGEFGFTLARRSRISIPDPEERTLFDGLEQGETDSRHLTVTSGHCTNSRHSGANSSTSAKGQNST
jgi:terminase small subunit-like protein